MPAETQVLKNAGEENATKTLCMAAETVECDFKPQNLMRRAVGDEDVLIDMKYCGVCHSDLSFAAGHMSGILGAVKFPCVPGHELAGVVAEVGKAVTKFAVGDHIGVGCMVDSCLSCANCKKGEEQTCTKQVGTYQAPPLKGGRSETFPPQGHTLGGYTTKMVVHEHFGIKIPAGTLASLLEYLNLLCLPSLPLCPSLLSE